MLLLNRGLDLLLDTTGWLIQVRSDGKLWATRSEGEQGVVIFSGFGIDEAREMMHEIADARDRGVLVLDITKMWSEEGSGEVYEFGDFVDEDVEDDEEK